ncbi:MAG: bacillithiol system redox-active protein YtxJ [Vicingaceae bacterium]
MGWHLIESEADLEKAIELSKTNLGVAIFKHSTRCSISAMAKSRLDASWDFNEELPRFYLDLISYREISQLIAERFNVRHESPQILIIKNGECVYNASHMSISVRSLHSELEG